MLISSFSLERILLLIGCGADVNHQGQACGNQEDDQADGSTDGIVVIVHRQLVQPVDQKVRVAGKEVVRIVGDDALPEEEENTEVLLPEEIKSYKNSILTPEAKAEIKNKILDFVENKKAYLNPDLNMDVLSESIGIPKYQITEVLPKYYFFIKKCRNLHKNVDKEGNTCYNNK